LENAGGNIVKLYIEKQKDAESQPERFIYP
jgi:hypothetical protein